MQHPLGHFGYALLKSASKISVFEGVIKLGWEVPDKMEVLT
jgi:hypothetical protein